jgi:hypothetical protein
MGLHPLGSETRRQTQNVNFKTVNQLDMNGNPILTSTNRRNPSHDYSTSFDQRVGGFAGRPTESYGFPQTPEEPEEELIQETATFPNLEEEKSQRDAEEIIKEKLIHEYIALLKERRDKEQEKTEKPPVAESKKKGSIFHFKTLCEEPREGNW